MPTDHGLSTTSMFCACGAAAYPGALSKSWGKVLAPLAQNNPIYGMVMSRSLHLCLHKGHRGHRASCQLDNSPHCRLRCFPVPLIGCLPTCGVHLSCWAQPRCPEPLGTAMLHHALGPLKLLAMESTVRTPRLQVNPSGI